MQEKIDISILEEIPKVDEAYVDLLLNKGLNLLNRKIVVLDDDPTGVQTVHNVYVYTDWKEESIIRGFTEENSLFFILTNSRSFSKDKTISEHRIIAENIVKASKFTGKEFVIISRSDSTLRGHYPTETQVLKQEIETLTNIRYDGEIIFPFFKEGGRFTIDNIHYVKENDVLVPAAQTEFANDKTFGYTSSHMGEWCEEKNQGAYKASDMVYISLKKIRALDIEYICKQLIQVKNFNKVIVNAVDYVDVKIFMIAFIKALAEGKEFIFRSAAAVTKVFGGIPDKPLLSRNELIGKDNKNGGIVLIGSHVMKTTRQLEELRSCSYPIEFIEFNQHRIVEELGLEKEVERVLKIAEANIRNGKTVVVYTRRERFDLDTDDKEKQLKISVQISDAVSSIIGRLNVRPDFIIAKGGITSSDVGTIALKVKRALVMGQIAPGIPVWMTGDESKFPGLPYVIFPGNVGEDSTLREIVELFIAV